MPATTTLPTATTTTDAPTVLIVDDNRPLADGFARALPDEYEVETAYTGREAREAFHDGVDAVLLDWQLPDAAGEEFRAEGGCRIAVVSAEPESSDLDCDRAVSKPVGGTDALRRLVPDLLDGGVSE